MSSISFIQVNARNIAETVEKINGKKCVGFEVIEKEIVDVLSINVDPQHTGVKNYDNISQPENTSASLFVLGLLPTIDPKYNDLIVLPSKLDIDSVAAATLWYYADKLANMENEPVEHDKFLKLCQRVKEIDVMDCGLGNTGHEWNPEYYKTQLKGVTEFNVLGAMCSDFKFPLVEKVNIMLDWLLSGKLPEKYQQQQIAEFNKEQSAIISQLFNVTCVETTARNVSSIVYSQSPFGVAFNSEFPTPNGKIPKFTIMAFNGRDYLDFASILADLNELEPCWGGNLNAGIIGSPFAGTNLTPQTVCEIVSRHVK